MRVDPFAADMIVDSILDWMDPDLEPRLNGVDGEAYLVEPNPPFPPYLSKNGPIDHITELLLIRGIEPALFYGPGGGAEATALPPPAPLAPELVVPGMPPPPGFVIPPQTGIDIGRAGLRDVFTPVGGARVNVNTASEAVLSLIPGLDENLAREIVIFRRGFDGLDGTEDDLPFVRIQDLVGVPGMVPELISILNRYCGVRSSSFEVHIETRLGDYEKTYVATLIRLGSRDVIVLNFYPL